MSTNRIRTIARTAAGSAMIASVLGLSAVGFSCAANAAPTAGATAGQAPANVCWYTYHPERGWWYC